MISVVSRDAAQTALIAGAIASVARPRDIIVLSGPMGAGKTAFTRGFAEAVGVESSPRCDGAAQGPSQI